MNFRRRREGKLVLILGAERRFRDGLIATSGKREGRDGEGKETTRHHDGTTYCYRAPSAIPIRG